jgi:hypothetical protein
MTNSKGHPSGCSGVGLEQAVEVSAGVLPKELQNASELPPKYHAMWHTPKVQYSGRTLEAHEEAKKAAKARHAAGLYAKGSGAPTMDDLQVQVRKASRDSGNQSADPNGSSTQPTTLNPAWVEWLMGFPIGWTDLEDSETP